jgi:hypothetical protein
MKQIKLDKCKECPSHKGIDNTSVRCNNKLYIGMALIMPSNHVPGIKNGTSVVRCSKGEISNVKIK